MKKHYGIVRDRVTVGGEFLLKVSPKASGGRVRTVRVRAWDVVAVSQTALVGDIVEYIYHDRRPFLQLWG